MTITEIPTTNETPTADVVELEAWLAGEIDKSCQCGYRIDDWLRYRCPESARWLGTPTCCARSRPTYMCNDCKTGAVEQGKGTCVHCQTRITAFSWVERIR